jgi:hypothetical protein
MHVLRPGPGRKPHPNLNKPTDWSVNSRGSMGKSAASKISTTVLFEIAYSDGLAFFRHNLRLRNVNLMPGLAKFRFIPLEMFA